MKKFLSLVMVLLIAMTGVAVAQHTTAMRDANNTFTGQNNLNGTGNLTLFYGNRSAVSGLVVNRTSTANSFDSGITCHVSWSTGGSFTVSSQPSLVCGNADLDTSTPGQTVGYWAYLRCRATGNCMAANWVIETWGGTYNSNTGHAATETDGLGEIDMKRGSLTVTNGSMWKGTVTGSPATGATTISYTPVANESIIGARRVYNLSRVTTGDGSTVKITGITGDVVTFSGANFTSADVGRFLAVGTTTALYAPTGGLCNGNDVVIDAVCVPDFDQIIAVTDSNHVQLEGNYDTIGLTTAWPQPFLVADGGTMSAYDSVNHTITIGTNSYSWQNGDTLISPPESHGEFVGANILMTPTYKRRGTGAPTSVYYAGSEGSSSVPIDSAFSAAGWFRYGLDFSAASFVNPQRAFFVPNGSAFSWGLKGSSNNFLGSNGNETFVGNDQGDAQICQYITAFDLTNYDKTCMMSGTTYGAIELVKGGTGTAKPLYIYNTTNGTVTMQLDKWYFDSSGNFYPTTTSPGNLGLVGSPIPHAYIQSLLGVTDTSKVTNLNADMVDGAHHLTGTATLTFTAIAAQTSQEQTMTISGASTTNFGAACSPRATLGNANISWSAWVSASNTISVRVTNPTAGSITPSAVAWGCTVTQ